MLIAPMKLAEYFPPEPPETPRWLEDRLRREVVKMLSGDGKTSASLLDTVFEEVLGLKKEQWQKGSQVDARWSRRSVTGEVVKPRRIWQGEHGAVLPVFVGEASAGEVGYTRIGVGRGRRAVSRVVEWLRRVDQKLAVLTNGRQWRLIHAGVDYEAWCEWDTDLWFEEGRPGEQVAALRSLLGVESLQPKTESEKSPLLMAVLESRRGQAELSTVLGERVRQAVETLTHSSGAILMKAVGRDGFLPRDVYIAATRLVMRCVVILFAEARGLLPRNSAVYNDSYSLQGLREQLDRWAGGRAVERLRHSHSAWARLMSLFRLVYEGSSHEKTPVPRYGGALFQPGDNRSDDPVLRAVAAFEHTENMPNDAVVHRVLELLTRSKVKVRQGRGNTWVEAPVDFSDLSSEYIGILYEGLLDFELKQAEEGEPVVFLNVGKQPALPFNRLDGMVSKDLADLLEKLNKGDKEDDAEEEDSEEETESDEAEEENGEDDSEDDTPQDEDASEEEQDDKKKVLREMLQIWAERAVKAAKLVKYPRPDTDPLVREKFNEDVREKAKNLVKRVVMPGDWYLSRWGGTRKGKGTFYTKPQLAEPTVRRTLHPLAFEPVSPNTGEAESDKQEWKPKKPEEILNLKVCDPAMGSGSFLISALRFLVDALVESLYYYKRLESGENRTVCKLADGLPNDHPSQETLPVPTSHPEFEDRLRARLKRHVVERCIYGVDLDPLAVELARMALWIETVDPSLPFSFLDHKLKCGNSLLGCWFDRFQGYPVMAWDREGGDAKHEHFVRHFRIFVAERGKNRGQELKQGDVWTQAIKDKRDNEVKPQLIALADNREQKVFEFAGPDFSPEQVHSDVLATFKKIHDLPVHESDKREEIFRQQILDNPDFRKLREAFDTWVALWFWPGDRLDTAPMPRDFLNLSPETIEVVRELQQKHRFFHWELEFPDVFSGPESGFDAVVGNPPWDIQKPNSKEFFSRIDPLYRAYEGKKSRDIQLEYFEKDSAVEKEWLEYRAWFNAQSNWCKFAGFPFGDRVKEDSEGNSKREHDFKLGSGGKKSFDVSQSRHDSLAKLRPVTAGHSDPEHPFMHQGSADLNSYKMFLEVAHALLRKRGQLGFVVPAAVYSDKGSTDLRKLLIDKSGLRWVFGFENSKKLFPIHSSFRFCCVIAEKNVETSAVFTAFGNSDYENWQSSFTKAIPILRQNIHLFSPHTRAIWEVETKKDMSVLKRVLEDSSMLGDEESQWNVEYKREFDMTNKRALFKTLEQTEKSGGQSLDHGLWRISDDIFVCFYTGKLINQYDWAYQQWIKGHGNTSKWEFIPFPNKFWRPEFVMPLKNVYHQWSKGVRLVFRDVARSTDEMTMINTVVPPWPCGNKVPLLYEENCVPLSKALSLCGVLNSFVYNYAVRIRLTGINLNKFIVWETPVPCETSLSEMIPLLVAQLALCHEVFAPAWLELAKCYPHLKNYPWKYWWAISRLERIRIRSLVEALVAYAYGLDGETQSDDILSCEKGEFAWILNPDEKRQKGFWRVDSDLPSPVRLPSLSLCVFSILRKYGLDKVTSDIKTAGWEIPEYIIKCYPKDLEYKPHSFEASDIQSSWSECEKIANSIFTLVETPEENTTSHAPKNFQQLDFFKEGKNS